MIGKKLSHYKILEKLGDGAKGTVYRAADEKRTRTVTLRLMPSALAADEKARHQWIENATAASALEHPNVAGVFEVDWDGPHRLVGCRPGFSKRQSQQDHR